MCNLVSPYASGLMHFLYPSTKNHSSAYSYHNFIDKFVETELDKLGLTGPFENAPWGHLMISPLMTSHKKPSSRRSVFDASFGMLNLNKRKLIRLNTSFIFQKFILQI